MEKYLPEKSQVILKCDMSAWQKVYYQQVTTIGRVDTGMLYMHSLGISSILANPWALCCSAKKCQLLTAI